jgi:hypothetical protein
MGYTMKKLLLVILASVALVLIANSTPAFAAVANWQKGISIQSRSQDDFASASFRQSIDAAAATGVNYVTLVVPVHQDNIYSSNVYTSGDTPSDNALRAGLSYIKSKGMQSAIAIHDNPYDYQWRAFIKANDTNAWFASYGALVSRYATIAQSVNASQMIIGTELSSMTVPENTSKWNQLITNVRSTFKGSLTYSAQRMGYMSDAQSLGFWPQLDKIGISAYYGLGNDGSVSSLQNAWNQYNQQEVSVLAAKYGKQVVFTEVGYVSRDGATNDPGTGYQLSTSVNTGLQANAYTALFQYWANDPNVGGVFFWDWSSDPNAGGSNDGGYTPQNKPAQDVMKQWYTQSSTITPPTTAPTVLYTVSSSAPASPSVGKSVATSISVSSLSTVNDMLVDIEIYNDQNQRVAQQFFEHQQLLSTAKSFTANWTPLTAGKYTVKVGVFTNNWQSSVYWNDNTQVVSVVNPAQPPVTTPTPVTPPVVTPTTPTAPTVPSAPVPTPTPTQPPVINPPATLPTAINIWWPGGTVSGVQPYKAVIDGRDIATYEMYWQVDSGALNKMANDFNPVAHKESLVDMTNWNWSASGSYTINFVAKDISGYVISEKSVVLKVVK